MLPFGAKSLLSAWLLPPVSLFLLALLGLLLMRRRPRLGGGAAGAQAKRLTPDEKQAKTDLYQAGLEALRKKHPNLKQEALIHKLARQLGQGHSVRTIKTYLPKSK